LGYRRLRLPDFKQLAIEGGKVVSLTHQPPLPPRKGWKDDRNEKFQ
jgi:hypothetical protein